MPKGPLLLATFGLGLNLFLWGAPAIAATAAAAHFALPQTPLLSESFDQAASRGPAITTSLAELIGAESDALQIASDALQQPTPKNIAPRANAAGAHVETALQAYLQAAQVLISPN